MAKTRQSSFRRILLTRILLLFVPVLFIGEIVALNKARSSLLQTARQNLTESAAIKAEKIEDAIATLKTSLFLLSQTNSIQSGSEAQAQEMMTQLASNLPTHDVECIQLTNLQTGEIAASSCGDKAIGQLNLPLPNQGVEIATILPPKAGVTGQREPQNQLRLLLSVLVPHRVDKVPYALSLRTTLHQKAHTQPGSLTGSLAVITEDGTILAHPLPERVGNNIRQYPYAAQLEKIIKNAIAGQKYTIDFSLQPGQDLIAGYTAIANPTKTQPQQKWVVFAVTSVNNALFGLEEFKLILIVLTVGLIGASLFASLYLAPYLAGPVEELRDYALNIYNHHTVQPVPHNFKIRELNQLAQALDQMVERLKAWAEELEIAWKEAKTANQIKSQFLATTSHELRNPLNIIINCVRLVHDGLCDNREEEMEFLKRADETAIHLLGIINDLLDISKIEAGKLSVVLEPVDLRQILLEVVNIQSVNVQQKGLQLKIELGSDPIPVKADAAKLKQVLINIIGNATKFTDKGSITVACEVQYIQEKSQVVVDIVDTGIGIDPAQQHKLFRPFVMVDGATTRKFEGTGLGLAISRNLIELMGGSITLKSAGHEQGTTVTIILPLIDISLLSPPIGKDLENRSVSSANEGKININSYPRLREEPLLDSNQLDGDKHELSLRGETHEVSIVKQKNALPSFPAGEAFASGER
ncbi:sensor histidine kinase [Fortiea contorta]|uniref:sensor histidine kinase n=1 Tax=Fortiea contorta TaxID=1892405 RepID=UPI00034CBAFC|nr:ATP-binding protein [Fortiea contorta]